MSFLTVKSQNFLLSHGAYFFIFTSNLYLQFQRLFFYFINIRFRRPVRLNLERFDDMALSGTRHPFRFNYRLAVDSVTGRFVDFNVDAYSNCGYEMDLSKGVMGMWTSGIGKYLKEF